MLASALVLLTIIILTAIAWIGLSQQRLHQIDTTLKAVLAGEMARPVPIVAWPAIFRQANSSFVGYMPKQDEGIPAALIMRADNDRLNLHYQSPEWPARLSKMDLPKATPIHSPGRPEPPDRPGRPPSRDPMPAGPPPQDIAPVFHGDLNIALHTLEHEGTEWRLGGTERSAWTSYAAVNITLARQQQLSAFKRLWVLVPILLILVGAGAWIVAGRALKSVHHLNKTIVGIDASDLHQRLAPGKEDIEFSHTIEAFNAMLDRIERSFTQARRFSADAAHELKTPLMILQSGLENALQKADPESDIPETLTKLLDEVQRLRVIVDRLLLLSKADSGKLPLKTQEIDLYPLLAELYEDYDMALSNRPLNWHIARDLFVQADWSLLQQVFHNLISNAIKYGRKDGWISLSAYRQNDIWCFDLANASHGIDPEHQDQLFDRFFRVDSARNREVDGTGLGLSLSREIVMAHGGDLVLLRSDQKEVCFQIRLPVPLSH